MSHLRNVARFGWTYLRRYWPRMVAGVIFGVLFGLSNATFVWATKTVFARLAPPPFAMAPATDHGVTVPAQGLPLPSDGRGQEVNSLKAWANAREKKIENALDAWLPRIGRPLDRYQLIGGLFLLPVLVAFRGYIGYLSSYCLGWVSERVVNDLRLDVLTKLNSLSLDFFNRSTIGDLLTRINGDTAMLQRSLSLGFSDLIKEPITIVSSVIYLCFIDWKLTIFALIFLPLAILPMRVLGKKISRASRGSVDASVSQASLLVELLSSIRIVKAFNLENYQVERYRKLSRDLVRHGMKTVQAREMVNPLIETVSMIGLGALIIYIFTSGSSLPDVAAFLVGVVIMYTPIKKLGQLHVLFEQTSVGVNRLMSVLNEKPSVEEPLNPKALPSTNPSITIDNLTFSYATHPVLQNFSLSIPKGLKLGIAGESGSGKSTLVNLLFRFYDPGSGTIKLDGVDLRELPTNEIRTAMALVSQEIVIYDLTAAENISLGKLNASREEIINAAKAANADEFISGLPHGYETRLGERGVTLSGGQRQRIAIARAFIRRSPILVLDEATASLDSQSEAEVQAAIDKVSQNHTVICVAHRLSTLRNMDRIIVLTAGRITEEGTFTELLKFGGAFSKMAAKQGIFP